MSKIIAVANQKGGVTKTTTTLNMAACLNNMGYKVLVVDLDPQSNLTMISGIRYPDELPTTITTLFYNIITNQEPATAAAIIHLENGIDLIPSDTTLTAIEAQILASYSREYILTKILAEVEDGYDYVIIDCLPSLGVFLINALTAADEILIPINAAYLSARGMEALITSIMSIKKNLNPSLKIAGMLITKYDSRSNIVKDIKEELTEMYGETLNIFDTLIPCSSKDAENASLKGLPMVDLYPTHKVAGAYVSFVEEYLSRPRCSERRGTTTNPSKNV